MKKPKKQEELVAAYYVATEKQYKNWGSYQTMPGVYAMHSGYYPKGIGDTLGQREAILEMDKQILGWLHLESNTPYKIADLGCGTGSISFSIGAQYPASNVYGITVASNQVVTAKEYGTKQGIPNVTIKLGSYLDISKPAKSFDRVLFIESLVHASDFRKALSEAFRVLKPGGFLHFQDTLMCDYPATEEEKVALASYCQGFEMPEYGKYPINVFTATLQAVGFKNIAVRDITANTFPSAKIIGDHAELREREKLDVPVDEALRRRGSVYLRELMKGYENSSNVIGYYTVQAQK